MLVLSRKKNEVITIGNDVSVVVVEIRGDKVRLGIDAPVEVPVHRKEVYDAISQSGQTSKTLAINWESIAESLVFGDLEVRGNESRGYMWTTPDGRKSEFFKSIKECLLDWNMGRSKPTG